MGENNDNLYLMQDAGTSKGIRILVVDDHEIDRLIMNEILSNTKCTVEYATNGVEALEILKSRPDDFDLVFLDLQMPLMDGYTTAGKVRDELKLEHVALIAMSASDSGDEKARCFVA